MALRYTLCLSLIWFLSSITDASVISLDSVDDMATATVQDSDTVLVADNARGGRFVYDRDSAATIDDGIVFNGPGDRGRYIRVWDNVNAHVSWFGATGGDDSDDDVPPFKAARDALGANGGGVIQCEGGAQYQFVCADNTSTFNINTDDITLEGNGCTISMSDDSEIEIGSINVIKINADVKRTRIRNIKIDGNRSGREQVVSENDHGIAITGGSEVTIEDCVIYACPDDGIYIEAGTPGTESTQSTDIRVTNVRMTDNGRHGVSVISGKRISFEDCESYANVYSSFDCEPNSSSAANAIDDIAFVRCVAHTSPTDGFQVANESGGNLVSNARVTNCHIYGCETAIFIGCASGVFSGNTIHDCDSEGGTATIYVTNNSNVGPILISNNTIKDCPDRVLDIRSSPTGPVLVSNNTLNSFEDIRIQAQNVSFIGNLVSDPTADVAMTVSGGNFHCRNNTFKGGEYCLVEITGGNGNTILGNTFIDWDPSGNLTYGAIRTGTGGDYLIGSNSFTMDPSAPQYGAKAYGLRAANAVLTGGDRFRRINLNPYTISNNADASQITPRIHHVAATTELQDLKSLANNDIVFVNGRLLYYDKTSSDSTNNSVFEGPDDPENTGTPIGRFIGTLNPVVTLPAISSISSATLQDGDTVLVNGSRGGRFTYDIDSSATIDSGLVFDGPGSQGRLTRVWDRHEGVSIIWFGAAGDLNDGDTDDSTAIQSAITAAIATASGDQLPLVVFPQTTSDGYYVPGGISVTSPCHLKGVGGRVRIDGNFVGNDNGLTIDDVDHCRVTNLEFTRHDLSGIYIKDSHQWSILNVYCRTNSQHGLEVEDSWSGSVTDCQLSTNTIDGFHATLDDQSNNIVLISCFCTNNGRYGAHMSQRSSILQGNYEGNNDANIWVEGCHGVLLASPYIEGVAVSGDSFSVSAPVEQGIHIKDSNGVSILGSDFFTSPMRGLTIVNSSDIHVSSTGIGSSQISISPPVSGSTNFENYQEKNRYFMWTDDTSSDITLTNLPSGMIHAEDLSAIHRIKRPVLDTDSVAWVTDAQHLNGITSVGGATVTVETDTTGIACYGHDKVLKIETDAADEGIEFPELQAVKDGATTVFLYLHNPDCDTDVCNQSGTNLMGSGRFPAMEAAHTIAYCKTSSLGSGKLQLLSQSAGTFYLGFAMVVRGQHDDMLSLPLPHEVEHWPTVYTDADTTPSVLNARFLDLENSGATSITDLDNGKPNQLLTLTTTDGNTTLVDSTDLVLKGGSDWTMANGSSITLRCNNESAWIEVSRSEN